LSIVQEKYPFYKNTYSKTENRSYIANNCINCGILQGDFFLYEEPDGPFFDLYEYDLDIEDENILIDISGLRPKYFIGLNEETGKLEYMSEFFN